VRGAVFLVTLWGSCFALDAKALQCVPYAREQSGIGLRGDAWTWWMAAAGQYDRGHAPRVGAVVVFKKSGSMSHGHVAVVAKVINSRRVLVDHANWAPYRGRSRGQVARLVTVADISPRNDWTEVRVWNDSAQELGTRAYPTYGFIYPKNAGKGSVRDRFGLNDPENDTMLPIVAQFGGAVDDITTAKFGNFTLGIEQSPLISVPEILDESAGTM
jgi:surface antigen